MRLLWNQFGLKVISIIFAVFIWLFVKHVTSERRLIEDVPVEVRLRPGATLVSCAPSTVNVLIRGTHDDLWQISRSDLSALLDLRREERLGMVRAALNPKAVRHPPRVEVLHASPATVTVHLRATEPVDSPPRTGVEERQ